jgi:TonB family protein
LARQEAARQEAARQELARQESARQEAARQEAARREAARLQAERDEAGRQAAAQQQAARQEAPRGDGAQREAAEAEKRREERLKAIGRQLDEEAARRDATAARQPPSLPYSLSSGRRARLFGRSDPNPELVRYAEAWARKIEANMTFDEVREVVKRPHQNPMVTVAIRSDGSVESVTFVVSSGVAELDEAIRRVVQNQMPYQRFSPALAREYDVIEIRRTWQFDVAIRLY